MYLLYLDHAGAIEDPAQTHFVLAGLSVFERQTYWLSQELDNIVARFNPKDPRSIELHGSPMHGGRGKKWRCFPVQDRIKSDIRRVSRNRQEPCVKYAIWRCSQEAKR
jgi:hypothetical protein